MASTRQQPGYSCEECRRRKARCDRVRPQCGTCSEAGTDCIVSHNRPARGPKKGQLKALRTRVATLEMQLEAQQGYSDPIVVQLSPEPANMSQALFADMSDIGNLGVDLDNHTAICDAGSDEDAPVDTHTPGLSYGTSATSVDSVISSDLQNCTDPTWHTGVASTAFMEMPPATHQDLSFDAFAITELMQADLDQLYFERFHIVAPVVHRQRYFSWARDARPMWAQACLRSAIRTVASAVSAPFRSFSHGLYDETQRLLEQGEEAQARDELHWGANNMTLIPLEQIQALLLLAHYELLCVNERKAMLTAGRVFRLVQMARLYDVDKPETINATGTLTPESFVEAEERRRTFWLAFSLDRFLCSRDELPLTLHEEMMNTRLPAPEANFQQSKPIRMDFLPEVMTSSGDVNLSPFAECMVLATLHGRCMSHRRQSLSSGRGLSGQEAREFWTRHEWLAGAVERHTKLLEQNASSVVERDPMVLFTHMLAQSAVIYLSSTVQSSPWQTVEYRLMASAYEERARRAALELVRLSRAVPELSCFKAHPFLPSAIACGAMYLTALNNDAGVENITGVGDGSVGQLLSVLRSLKDVSNLARDLLFKLKTDLTMASFE